MSRTKGDPRQALIDLGPDAPFVDKATIAICGPDLIDVDYFTLMLVAGKFGGDHLDYFKCLPIDITPTLESIAGKILIELSRDEKRQKNIFNAINAISKEYQKNLHAKSLLSWKQNYASAMDNIINLPLYKMQHILQNFDTWDSIETELERNEDFSDENFKLFSTKILSLKYKQDILHAADEVFYRLKFIKLYMNQAILPIEACILLGARKVNVEKTIRIIQTRLENSKSQQKNHSPKLDLSEISLPHPVFDTTGSEFWRSKRLLLKEWEEMTDPIFLTKTGLRNHIITLTGREPSTKDVETSAEIVGHKIKSPN
jgi:hypothetical protein